MFVLTPVGAMRPMSLVVLVAAICGCNRLETTREISSDVAECDTADVGALSLTPGYVRRVQAPATPSGLVFTSRDTILAIDGKSSGLSVYAGHSAPTWLSAPEPLRTITRAGPDVLVGSARTIYRVHEARLQRVAQIPRNHGDIVSLAADRNSVWAATDGGTTSPARLLTALRKRPHRWSDIPLPRPVRLEPLEQGRIAAAEIAAPHHVGIFDESLRRRAVVAPMPGAPRRGDDSAAWFTQSLVRLDCGRLLQVVTDMRSARRMVHMYSIAGSRPHVLRSRTLSGPMGFVQAIPEDSIVVGVTDGPGWWEAVLFAFGTQPWSTYESNDESSPAGRD